MEDRSMSVKKIHPALKGLAESGFTLLEVLITLIILAIGLLGLASLQSKIQLGQVESYQRAQAVLLLEDMVNRINTASLTTVGIPTAAPYVTGTTAPLGDANDGQPASCAGLAVGLARDQCEWSNALKGASEIKGTGNVGAMVSARGCVEQLQAENPTPTVCTPGIYRVSVVWQGLNQTVEPALLCAAGSGYGNGYRRVISTQLVIGLPSC